MKLSIPIEVGRRYKITNVEEKGVTIFQPGVLTLVSGLRKGEYADAKKISENVYKGIKDLYGTQGYIQADVNPIPKFIDKTPEEGEVEWTLDVEEGRQFTLRRLEFIGNTNTRDVVMRREVLMNEGDAYNKRNWDLSIIRLNQLGLFDEVKEKDAITRTNDRDQTVDIDLQVKEKGRQQIQLNGGVSGFAGSFFGLEYSTNNLLGYGESLSFAVSGGNRSQSFQFGFTEPYLMGKPISLGFQVFASKSQFVGQGFNFDQAFQSQFFGLSSIDADTLFTQRTVGGTVSLSGPLAIFTRKLEKYSRFTRLGLSYSLTGNAIQDPSVNRDTDQTNNIPVIFSQPRIITSRIVPSIYYNTKNAYLDPTNGQSLFLGFSMAGGILGGDVNTVAPSLEYQYFRPVFRRRTEKPHVLAMRFKADHIRSFGKAFDARQGDTRSLSFIGGIPIFERYFLGGEYDIRGYNFRSITPVVASDSFLSTRGAISPTVVDPNDSTKRVDARTQGPVADNILRQFSFQAPEGACGGLNAPDSSKGCNTVRSGTFFTPVGADTQLIYNIEYRVPVISILSIAAFADVGTAFNMRKYDDQITSSNFVNGDITPSGVLLNPAGNVATDDEVVNAPKDPVTGAPLGFRTVFLQGDSQRFDILRTSQGSVKFLSDIRSSLGMEFRVQMPVINVPFRLIFAYNPQAKTDLTDPTVLFIERKTVVRFSVGRTF